MTEGYPDVAAPTNDPTGPGGGVMNPFESSLLTTTAPPASGGASVMKAGCGSRLDELRARPRRPGEASYFYADRHFHYDAVKVWPGEYFVSGEDLLVKAVLGSCVAVCVWDDRARIGGMNHFMVTEADAGADRDGAYAMELMLNEMIKLGGRRETLQARVFGGATLKAGVNALHVGERSASFVRDYLAAERIPVVAQDVLDIHPRKVCFFPVTGKALVKRLAHAHPEVLAVEERKGGALSIVNLTGGGTVELF